MKKAAQDKDPIEQAVLNAFEIALDAQLRAIRRAGKPLHISEILDRIEKLHGRRLDRESVVSTLVKKIARGDRFVRTDKNVFAVKGNQS